MHPLAYGVMPHPDLTVLASRFTSFCRLNALRAMDAGSTVDRFRWKSFT